MYKYGNSKQNAPIGQYGNGPHIMPPAPNCHPQARPGCMPQNAQSPAGRFSPPAGAGYNNQTYQRPPMAPQAKPAPSAPAAAPAPTDAPFISRKIYKVTGRDKVMDLRSLLTAAKVEDFANVHGRGGKDHAQNSTIKLTICDYTKGKGDKSVTTSYNLDVELIEIFSEAAKDARLGKLTVSPGMIMQTVAVILNDLTRWEAASNQTRAVAVPEAELTATGKVLAGAINQNTPNELHAASNAVLKDLRKWMATGQKNPMCTVPMQEIINAKNALIAALNGHGVPAFEYGYEKNNPYSKNNQGYVTVSKVYIAYTPTRPDGSISRYPWFLQVENFDAPLNTKANGASSHNSSSAINRKSASINLSADDFAKAMGATKRFIGLWEHAVALPVIRTATKRLDEINDHKKNESAA